MKCEDHLRYLLSLMEADPIVSEYWKSAREDADGFLKAPENIAYKFNEDNLLNELRDYIDNTYSGHYNKKRFQAAEFVIDTGHGVGFAVGNILKYAQRYKNKGDEEDQRKDILKILHYAIILLYIHDSEEQ